MKTIHGLFGILSVLMMLGLPVRAAQPVAHPENALVDGAPMIATWTPPVYPPDALREKTSGSATVRIVVDDTGHVTAARVFRTSDARFGAAALAAVKKWTFRPAIEDGKPVAQCIDIPIPFLAARGAKTWPPGLLPPASVVLGIKPAPRTAAAVKSSPISDTPAALQARRLEGAVAFVCWVDAGGHASALRILAATHADFVPPALESFAKWQFQPATQGDLTVGQELRGEITFGQFGVKPDEQLAANGLTGPDGAPPAAYPTPQNVVDPVWPYDALMKGESGSASADFTVTAGGQVTAIVVREASQPDFGRALVAALEGWTFRPVFRNGQNIAMALTKHAEFISVPLESGRESDDPLARLVRLARAGGLPGGAGLDEKLTPLYRAMPLYPVALQAGDKPAGQAVIEFVVDRDGRVRLPRILSATREEFGWSAATAVAQWVFQPPHRGGQPTEVKVKLPFNFAAPAG